MPVASIHIIPDDSFDDWIVQDDSGRELGHYQTREAAELFAQPLAQKRGGQFVIHLPDGRTSHQDFARWWGSRFFQSLLYNVDVERGTEKGPCGGESERTGSHVVWLLTQVMMRNAACRSLL
jgi:hypothetical protein